MISYDFICIVQTGDVRGQILWSSRNLAIQEVVEDWMSVSFWLPHSAEAQIPMTIPEAVEQLGHDTDGIRWQSVPSLSTVSHIETEI